MAPTAISILIPTINLVFITAMLVWVSLHYRKYHYQTVRYLLIAVILLVISSLSNFFAINRSYFITTVIYNNNIVPIMISVYFLWLFFESFENEYIFTKGNLFLGAFLFIITTAIFLTSVPIAIISEVNNLDILDPANIDNFSLTAGEEILILLYIISFALSFVFIILIILKMGRRVLKKYKTTKRKEVKKLFRNIGIVAFLIPVMPVLVTIFVEIVFPGQQLRFEGVFVPLGLIIIFRIYSSGGIFILQPESLRKLFIINDFGLPLYTYTFQEFEDENKTNSDDKDILFTGALNAISNLLNEFTGDNKTIKEIKLENLVLMVRKISKNLSIVLISDKSSKYFQESLEKFSQKSLSILENINTELNFGKETISEIDKLVQDYFGYGKLILPTTNKIN